MCSFVIYNIYSGETGKAVFCPDFNYKNVDESTGAENKEKENYKTYYSRIREQLKSVYDSLDISGRNIGDVILCIPIDWRYSKDLRKSCAREIEENISRILNF